MCYMKVFVCIKTIFYNFTILLSHFIAVFHKANTIQSILAVVCKAIEVYWESWLWVSQYINWKSLSKFVQTRRRGVHGN